MQTQISRAAAIEPVGSSGRCRKNLRRRLADGRIPGILFYEVLMSRQKAAMPDYKKTNPINETDAEARATAHGLLRNSRTAAIAFIHPETLTPSVSRIAFSLTPDSMGLTLISSLSLHTKALHKNPRTALLLGEPGPRGDPLNHPRISVNARAVFIDSAVASDMGLRELWLAQHPKSKLYVDFRDFCFVAFELDSANLNGGFAKAYALDRNDLKVSPM